MPGKTQFLKCLEISGFKSFAAKTVLDFTAGIVAVVGPNGSGKSNIVDAFRWALGEREARQLRSAKSENLIFAGTPKRPALGLAQVTLFFNNQEKILPLEFEEVTVSRKADRSGMSQYFINKSEILLKELIEILAKGRLGTKGLLIINQGESDILIKSSPTERRLMVEELTGLREFQLKKKEAERKLEATGLNLEKAKALVGEIKPHLRFLRRQANRYKRREEISQELKNLEEQYFASKYNTLQREAAGIDLRLASLNRSLKEKSEEKEKISAKLKKIENAAPPKTALNEIRERQQKILDEQSRIQKEFGRLEGRLEFFENSSDTAAFAKTDFLKLIPEFKTKLQNWLNETDLERIKTEIKGLLEKIEKFISPAAEGKERASLKEAKEKLAAELDNFDHFLKELLDEEKSLTGGFEDFNRNFRKAFEELEVARAASSRLENERNQLQFEKEKIAFRQEELFNQAKEWGRNLDDLKNKSVELKFASADEKSFFKLRGELAAIGEIDEAGFAEAQETESRYQFLTGQIADLEKAASDLSELTKDLSVKIDSQFRLNLQLINEEFNRYFRLTFGGGRARFTVQKSQVKKDESDETEAGLEIDLILPRKKVHGLASLSGGERSLVSLAALFALIAVKPPPFLVLDEIDAALDEVNARRFAELLKEFSHKTQFVVITHNRATMEVADILYGITMGEDGVSKVLSLKLDPAA